MECSKCNTNQYLKYIYRSNCHTESISNSNTYYQCLNCKGYIQITETVKLKWTADCPLSDTLA